MESQPQNPEFRINSENFQPCRDHNLLKGNNGMPRKSIYCSWSRCNYIKND